MVDIAILGFGTVGSGVYEVTRENKDILKNRSSELIRVKKIFDKKDFSSHPAKHLFALDFQEILDDSEISIVIEAIGGLSPAFEYTKNALKNGKSVVTSNKELVDKHGIQLQKLASDNNVSYLFEASVGGGTPIIRPLKHCLVANRVVEISGILNGTTNYILTQMFSHETSFEEALADASRKGYAEQDPTDDIEGYDVERKIRILARLAFGNDIEIDEIPVTGISTISLEDIRKAKEDESVIKLIARAKFENGKVLCEVKPTRISNENPLYGVNGVFNAVVIDAKPVGRVMFYGQGAGKLPTASAVVADIVAIIRGE